MAASLSAEDRAIYQLICSVAVATWWQHAFRIARVGASIVHETCRFDSGAAACRNAGRWS